jgi:regulator of polyketide synthase expression
MFPEILLKGVPREYISRFASSAAKISGASDEETTALLDELFRQNLNISKTAKELFMHRNTLIYRLDKLKRVTGLDVSCFDDAVILRLLLAMSRLGEK